MEYIWWYVPVITSPMLIGLIATLHVLISHYAVGGGIFLAWELGYAYQQKDEDYVAYLHSHAKFFVLLTVVLGAITGVGIWWTIGLASPLATEMLIRTFVFGWATEWVFFVVELVAAFIFLYLWGRMKRGPHLMVGRIYAIAAWISLVLITGITAFMLCPGEKWLLSTLWGTGEANFWAAFLNPQFIPQTIARSGAALVLAGVYVTLHAAIVLKEDKDRLRRVIVERLGQFIIFGSVLVAIGVVWGYTELPESAKMSLFRAAALNIFCGLGAAAGAMMLLMLGLMIWKPRWLTPITGVAMFGMALAAMGCGEFVREGIRKPYVVYDVVLGNQVLAHEAHLLKQNGLLQSGRWTRHFMYVKYPYIIGENGELQLDKIMPDDRADVGRVIFMHHCNDCHAERYGYSGVTLLASSQTREEKVQLIKNLNGMIYNMPPWCGTDEEAELLADYLEKIAAAYPLRFAGRSEQVKE